MRFCFALRAIFSTSHSTILSTLCYRRFSSFVPKTISRKWLFKADLAWCLIEKNSVAVCCSRFLSSDESSTRQQLTRGTSQQQQRTASPLAASSPTGGHSWFGAIMPYLQLMRLDRPTGTWLTLFPGLWALAAAAPAGSLPDTRLVALFTVGALMMRGFGCTVNDMWDRDIDRRVQRTRQRPLAAGRLSRWDAIWFAGGQAGLACLILLQLNWHTVVLGLGSVGMVVTYPLVKRVSYWPQAALAIVFNWGALLGFSAVQGSELNWAVALPMYVAALSWTLIYDTVYAHQDKHDDELLGVKSTALRFGKDTPFWLAGFGCSMAAGLIVSGAAGGMPWEYFAGVGAACALLARQVITIDVDDPLACGRMFAANRNVGALVLLGCVCGSLLKS